MYTYTIYICMCRTHTRAHAHQRVFSLSLSLTRCIANLLSRGRGGRRGCVQRGRGVGTGRGEVSGPKIARRFSGARREPAKEGDRARQIPRNENEEWAEARAKSAPSRAGLRSEEVQSARANRGARAPPPSPPLRGPPLARARGGRCVLVLGGGIFGDFGNCVVLEILWDVNKNSPGMSKKR